jgi:NAD(P)-dependent dehydrogenase (short-subunit alcohol dehydrogenase family)
MLRRMAKPFDDKVAIVTGGASGIGRGIVLCLAERGARVVIADINESGADSVLKEVERAGGRAQTATVDVRSRSSVEALVNDISEEHGRLDFMFNNAGVCVVGDASKLDDAQWDQMVDVNIRGVLHGTTVAYARMAAQGHGHIVNTGSIAGLVPAPTLAGYAMSKHAVVGLSTSLRIEAARKGVNVSVVCPGVIDTPMLHETVETIGSDQDEATRAVLGSPYPAERCARDLLEGVARNDAVIIVTGMAKTISAMHRAAPAVVRGLIGVALRRRMAKGR